MPFYDIKWSKAYYSSGVEVIEADNHDDAIEKARNSIGGWDGQMQYHPDDDQIEVEERVAMPFVAEVPYIKKCYLCGSWSPFIYGSKVKKLNPKDTSGVCDKKNMLTMGNSTCNFFKKIVKVTYEK